MKQILDEFDEKVNVVIDESAKQVSKEAVEKLKATSPRRPNGGQYANSWTLKTIDDGYVVYNTQYMLTHLLENGHVVRPTPKHPNRKSRVEGQKHIKPVETWANRTFQKLIKKGLEK